MSALCHSVTCPARRDCVRNAACPDAAPRAPDQESAIWYPQAGRACPGFVEPGRPWWQRMVSGLGAVGRKSDRPAGAPSAREGDE